MEGIEIINQRLKESLDSDNLEAFDKAYIELYRKIWCLMFFVKEETFEGLDLTDVERVKLYIYGSIRDQKIDQPNYRDLKQEQLPVIFSNYINNNQNTFYNILVENRDIQRLFALWFREHGFIEEKDPKELYAKIFNLEEFRNLFLSDNEIVDQHFSHNHEFFELIPNDYAYLIALYDVKRDRTGEKTKRLYDMKFSDKLNEVDRLELMKTHIQLATEPNLFNISIADRMMEFEYCLKQITEDVNYLEVLKNISSKTGLDLKTVMKFASKYDGTSMYKDISSRDEIDEDTIEKIRYLSGERKIKDESILDRIDELSINDLKQAEKTENRFIKLNIRGGPQSKTNKKFFEDGFSREIISITSDGEVKALEVPVNKNHEDGIKEIYSETTVFPKDCTAVIERSIHAIKEISSITLTIENENCFLVMPTELTEEQYSSLNDLLDKSLVDGQIGIITFDRDKDKEEMLIDGDCFSPKQVKEYLTETKKTSHSL